MDNRVFIWVASSKHMMRFGRKGKLAPKFINTYEFMEQVGKVAYKFMLSISMDHIHGMFHVLSLHKYIGDPSHVLKIENIKLSKDLSYNERPIQILDKRII